MFIDSSNCSKSAVCWQCYLCFRIPYGHAGENQLNDKVMLSGITLNSVKYNNRVPVAELRQKFLASQPPSLQPEGLHIKCVSIEGCLGKSPQYRSPATTRGSEGTAQYLYQIYSCVTRTNMLNTSVTFTANNLCDKS